MDLTETVGSSSNAPYPDLVTKTDNPASEVETMYPGIYSTNIPSNLFTQTLIDTKEPYPQIVTQVTMQSGGSGDYPGVNTTLTEQANDAYPGFSGTSASTFGTQDSSPIVQPQTAVSTVTPSLTPSNSFTLTRTPTLSNQSTPLSSIPPLSLTPSKTLFLTPTPTITPTPTNSRTPFPLPPWISSELHSTDPQTVKLSSGRIQLIEFFAYWSGHCQAMASILYGLEKEYTGRVDFSYLDIDNPANDIFKQQLLFRVEPQFFLLDPQGKILKQWIGYVTVEQFRNTLDSALQ